MLTVHQLNEPSKPEVADRIAESIVCPRDSRLRGVSTLVPQVRFSSIPRLRNAAYPSGRLFTAEMNIRKK